MPPASVLPVLAVAIDSQLGAAGTALSDGGPDGIHDLRVATRRLRAALELWLAASPGKKLDRSRRALRRLGRRLGTLREADVDLSELSELRRGDRSHDVAIEFVMASEIREKARREKALERELRRVDLADLSREIRSDVEGVLAGKKPGDCPLGEVARDELTRRLPRLSSLLDRALLHPTPRSLHRLRIELKKFRYCVELCVPAYDGRRIPHLVKRLKGLQDALGLVQDANALHLRLAKLRADLRRDGLPAIEASLLPPMRAVAALSRGRTAEAVRDLETVRREAFFSRFRAALH